MIKCLYNERAITWYRLSFVLLILISYSTTHAQVFRPFTYKEGAPEGAILSIVQDKSGFMWYGTTTGLYRYDSRTFKEFRYDESDPNSISSNVIDYLFCDSGGGLWVGTSNGLNKYNSKNDSFIRFNHNPNDEHSIAGDTIYCINEDKHNVLWIGTSQGLNSLDYKQNKVQFVNHSLKGANEADKKINKIEIGEDNQLWLATREGLLRMNISNDHCEVLNSTDTVDVKYINDFNSIYDDKKGKLWLGTRTGGLILFHINSKTFELRKDFLDKKKELPIVSGFANDIEDEKIWIATWSGLVSYDCRTDKVNWHTSDPNIPLSLNDDVILTMYKDTKDGIWVGTYYHGISYLNIRTSSFSNYPFYFTKFTGEEYLDGWMGMTPKDQLWLLSGGRDKLLMYDKSSKTASHYNLDLGSSPQSNHFYIDKDLIMWYSGDRTLRGYSIDSQRVKEFEIPNTANLSPRSSRIYRMIEDREGQLWIGGGFGLYRFNKTQGSFQDFNIRELITCIFEDSQGNIWAGGVSKVWLLKKGTIQFQIVELSTKDNPGSSSIWRIIQDPAGRVWMITNEKLRLYDKDKFVSYTKHESAWPKSLLDIQADQNGFLWLSSGRNLVRYHPDKGSTHLFTYEDGLPLGGILRVNSAVSDQEGIFYVIGNNGTFSFKPEDLTVRTQTSRIVLSSLRLFNKNVKPGDETGILNQEISQQDELVFRHDQNIFTLDFAILSYNKEDQNQYSYKLEGFEKNWNDVKIPSATYTNLPTGSYTFLVKATDGDGYSENEPLRVRIVILAPWWATWYAYLSYFLLFVLFVYLVARFFWLRSSIEKESELQNMKLNFFTNISHEIRTHLTLISGPLEKASQLLPLQTNEGMFVSQAKYSSDRLMNLVNELLDFRKIESGNVLLHVANQDISRILQNVLTAFETLIKEKDINIQLHMPEVPVMVWVDEIQIQKVFYNLLSNAVKFAPQRGKIGVSITEENNGVTIKIWNNGSGIPSQYLSRLFTNFYQVEENKELNTGYGIGLAYSKEIVKQHFGDISVTSEFSKDAYSGLTCFTIRLLKGNTHFNDIQLEIAPIVSCSEFIRTTNGIVNENVDQHVNSLRKTLLLIDDNNELRSFTKEAFREKYNILEAEDGLKGLEMTKKHLPDLVLCDVMMPFVDGFEVCKQLKEDENTSAIPIILLTAKSATSSMIEGLEKGADAYVVKPYDLKVLELKIHNCIQIRSLLKDQTNTILTLEPDSIPINDEDGQFVIKLKDLIMNNIEESDFGVNEMALELGMSVSVLYRKLRALTGMTVNEFVKVLRMKKAIQLLETTKLNINQIANIVGYEDAKYFSREFKKVYGKNPNEIRKQSVES